MKKKAATRSRVTTKLIPTRSIMKRERRRRKVNMVTRNSTRRDQRPLDITRKPTRMNTTKSINSMMTSTKKANIRNMATTTLIIMRKMANIRKEVTTKLVIKSMEARRRVAQKRDTSMKTTRDTSTRKVMNHITLTMRSMERKEARKEEVNMGSNTAVMVEAAVVVTINNSGFYHITLKEAFLCLITIFYLHDTRLQK